MWPGYGQILDLTHDDQVLVNFIFLARKIELGGGVILNNELLEKLFGKRVARI